MKDSRSRRAEFFFQRQEAYQIGENSTYDEAHGPRNQTQNPQRDWRPEPEEKKYVFKYAFPSDGPLIKARAKFLCSACPRRNPTAIGGEK